MKKIILLAIVLSAISCKKENQENFGKTEEAPAVTETPAEPQPQAEATNSLGKEIFEGKGTCFNCHKADTKTIGPSLKDIAKMYKEKNASIVAFLQEKGKPIVDPTQYEIMKANFAITKNLPENELKAIEDYIMSY